MKCTCGNPEMGFNCMCEWMKSHPGNTEYICSFCGFYNASKARCGECVLVDDDIDEQAEMEQEIKEGQTFLPDPYYE
jgi:hypothetical protein